VPAGLTLAANTKPKHRLTGDIEALKLIDLEEHGLAEYRSAINSSRSSFDSDLSASTTTTVIPAKKI
jgi:hypothetical protein